MGSEEASTFRHVSHLACGTTGSDVSKIILRLLALTSKLDRDPIKSLDAPDGSLPAYFHMAPHRAFSFPLSHIEEDSRIPPFELSKKNVSALRSCEAFQTIRELLLNGKATE